jgi:LacI family sucrose operon transcriptional repressor
VDGLIVASSMLNDADYLKLSEQLPVVLFDRMNSTPLPLVITDAVTPPPIWLNVWPGELRMKSTF